jgi:hypothetical protein
LFHKAQKQSASLIKRQSLAEATDIWATTGECGKPTQLWGLIQIRQTKGQKNGTKMGHHKQLKS